MIAVDTNILVYAHRKDSPQHPAARDCLRLLGNSLTLWAVPWPCIHEFIAVATNPKVFRPSSTLIEAIAQVDAWLESPSLTLISETEMHWSHLKTILTTGKVMGAMTHDARVAAICLQHGVSTFYSVDRDFSRFPDLRTINPLTS